MPTIVGIFKFISREIFILSCVEHEKSFITSGPKVSSYVQQSCIIIKKKKATGQFPTFEDKTLDIPDRKENNNPCKSNIQISRSLLRNIFHRFS